MLASNIKKHLLKNTKTHLISLMYKLLTSSKDSDDLSIGFHLDVEETKKLPHL